MPAPARRLHVTPRAWLRRPRVINPPVDLQRVVSSYSVARRENSLSAAEHRRFLVGGINLHALRNAPRDSNFQKYLGKVRDSVAGQIAVAAKTNDALFDFLQKNKYVLVDGRGRLTGANSKGIPGIRRARIATEDIRWLVNHL